MLETVVVGGGIAGCAAALALGSRGAAVTVVEGARPGAGATGASAGILAAQYEVTEPSALLHLKVESRARWPRFAATIEELSGQSVHLRGDGLLVANFSETDHERAQAMAAWQRQAGLAAELIPQDEALRVDPGISERPLSYLWLPDEARVDTQRLAEALYPALARANIRVITGNPVAAIRERDGHVTGVIMADDRSLDADAVVLAAGAWSGTIRGLPRPLPVRPIRGQILRYPPACTTLRRVVADPHGRYLVPRADGSILAGSTMEETGFDQSITDEGKAVIQEAAGHLAPRLAQCKPVEHWAGLRPLTADSAPVLGPDPNLAGLVYATGHGRSGILLAPVTGEMVAEILLDGDSTLDWRPFRPDRFQG